MEIMADRAIRTDRSEELLRLEHKTPVDSLDALFYAHDLAYQLQPQSKDIPSADLALIGGIELLTAAGQLDAEASLYAGGTILGLLSFMAVNGNLPSGTVLVPAETTALHDIEYGLSHLTFAERGDALNFLESIATDTSVLRRCSRRIIPLATCLPR